MLKKSSSENHLINLYHSCSVFKKYYKYNLWFGSFSEYDNIKYCKNYIQKYTYFWIHTFLLQCFSLVFVIFLYRSPSFIQFVESGFLKYLDYDFLLSFYNNRFTSDSKGKQKLKVFVKSYFQVFLKRRLKKDLSIAVITAINEITLNFLTKCLISRFKKIQIYVDRVGLSNKTSSKLVRIKKKKIYFAGLFFFNSLTKKIYYRPCFIDFDNSRVITYIYSLLTPCNIHKSLFNFKNFKDKKKLISNVKVSKVSKSRIEKTFIDFSRKSLSPTNSLSPINKDLHHLIDCFEFLVGETDQDFNIGLHKNLSVSVNSFLFNKPSLFKKPLKNFKLLKTSFNICFVKHKILIK